MKFVKIKKISPVGKKDIFHLTVEKNQNYFANNLCVHNCGYRGEIEFRFKYIIQPEDLIINNGCVVVVPNKNKIYKKGDRIGQLLAENKIDIKFELVNELPDSDRGIGGFGSTEKKG